MSGARDLLERFEKTIRLIEKEKRATAIWFYQTLLNKIYSEIETIFGLGLPRISKIMKNKTSVKPHSQKRIMIMRS